MFRCALIALLSVTVAALRVSPGVELAETLAGALPGAKGSFLQGVPLLAGLADDLSKAHPDQPMSAIQYDLMEALQSSASAEGLPAHDIMCVRDYSACCPEGWIEEGDGESCLAPIEYAGSCPAKMSYGGLTPLEKSLQALQCGALFACIGSCTKDYEELCPDGWIEEAGGFCMAPGGYSGRCVRRQNFGSFNELQKASWAQSCGVSWPCRGKRQGAALSEDLPRGRTVRKALVVHNTPASFLQTQAKIAGDEIPPAYPVVNVAADEPAAVSLMEAEEGKSQEQMLAKLEEKVLKLKETMSNVLSGLTLQSEKLAEVGELVLSEKRSA